MFRRDYLKWWMRPAFLRPWGKRSNTLFAGPWLGEFGWELMCWQAFVRKQSRFYEKTIVHCPAGREDLYADFASEIIPHSIKCTAECDGAKEADILAQAVASARKLVPTGADHLLPLGYQPLARQEFLAFGKKREGLGRDILFHPRGRNFGTYRNWDLSKWESLLADLNKAGYKLGCIGVRGATLQIQGDFTDYRDIPLAQTVDLM